MKLEKLSLNKIKKLNGHFIDFNNYRRLIKNHNIIGVSSYPLSHNFRKIEFDLIDGSQITMFNYY